MAKKGPSSIEDRLHRIEGQIRGIERLVVSDAKVEDILIQIQAVMSSMESVKLELIKKQLKDALLKQLDGVVDLLK